MILLDPVRESVEHPQGPTQLRAWAFLDLVASGGMHKARKGGGGRYVRTCSQYAVVRAVVFWKVVKGHRFFGTDAMARGGTYLFSVCSSPGCRFWEVVKGHAFLETNAMACSVVITKRIKSVSRMGHASMYPDYDLATKKHRDSPTIQLLHNALSPLNLTPKPPPPPAPAPNKSPESPENLRILKPWRD